MDLGKQLLGIDGKPFSFKQAKEVDEKGNPTVIEDVKLTLGYVLKSILNHVDTEEKVEKSKLYIRGKQAYEISIGVIPSEFDTVEGIAEAKEIIANVIAKTAMFSSAVAYQVSVELENHLKTTTK